MGRLKASWITTRIGIPMKSSLARAKTARGAASWIFLVGATVIEVGYGNLAAWLVAHGLSAQMTCEWFCCEALRLDGCRD